MFKKLQQKKKKGQSTLEYIILVTGVVVVLLVFLGPTGVFRTAFNGILNAQKESMTNMSGRLANSR